MYASIKVWQELEKTTQSSASLQLLEASMFIAGDVFKAKVNIDCWSRLRCLHNILIHSNYTRTSHVRDLFAFYLTPNDRINNCFLPFGKLERVRYVL